MDAPDVTVRVLYDFEYSTKDGREIKIKCGEKLFLISKTNTDWWHVIRSSERRPFYVPATYVQEIKKSGGTGDKKENKPNSKVEKTTNDTSIDQVSENEKHHQSFIHVKEDEPVGFSMGYRNRSSSLEDKKMYSVKLSSVDRQRILGKGKLSLNPQFTIHTEVLEEVEPKNITEEVDYVNLRKEGDEFLIEENSVKPVVLSAQLTETIEDSHSNVSVLEENENNFSNKRNSDSDGNNTNSDTVLADEESNGYSFVSDVVKNEVQKSESSSSLPVLSSIPHSNSLEELALEIQFKTFSIRSNNSSTASNVDNNVVHNSNLDDKIPSASDNSFESNVDSAIGCSESSKEESSSKNDINLQCSPVPLQRKLHYVGSFKTKQERQKWAKQHFSPEVQNEVEIPIEAEKKIMSDGVTCIKIDDSMPAKVQEPLVQSCTVTNESTVQEIKSDSKNVVSIAVNYGNIPPTSNAKDTCNSFLESSRKTEEHLQQIHQNLGIAQEVSANSDDLISLNTKHKKTIELIRKELASYQPDIIDSSDGSKSNKAINNKVVSQPKTSSSLKDSTESIRGQNSTNSEKGSTDSLLDIDKNSNSRKISCGTTTSESFVPTDGEDLDEHDENSESETDSVVLGLSRIKTNKTVESNKKKISLTRNRRVESQKTRYVQQAAPPSPTSVEKPIRTVLGDWNEYMTGDGRIFYYNTLTNEKSWKPPRQRNSNSNEDKTDGNLSNVYSGSSSPLAEVDDKLIQSRLENLPLPAGWKTKLDEETGLTCYINLVTGAKWFSSTDYEGRVYFFEENSNESSWNLPETNFITNINENLNMGAQTTDKATEKNSNRVAKTRSMIFDDRREDVPAPQVIPRNWPQLWDGHMCVLREGILNRTKITENAKRLRKNWASSHVVLTELFLLFFKDIKAFAAMKSGGGRPEMCVDLNGALIDKGDKMSSRKNVFVISTVLGLQVLIQSDCQIQAEQWLMSIQSAIKNLPSGIDSCIRLTKSPKDQSKPEEVTDDSKKLRIGRSKSVKLKNKEGSIEDLSSAERQTKIKARLKKFFHRRPTMEALVKKGIWKDEPAFGCYLEQVCGKEHPCVPIFVRQCIECIERSEENMKTDGLYRASGNLSQVQKIRLQVDQNNYEILKQEEDVHVLTGALKLFFRELKKPLIPFNLFHKALKASNLTHHNRKEKLSQFRDIVKNLPTANHDTLKFLLQHLLRVTKYQEFNRMHIPNLAIVFGPTLMWPEQESSNMALDLMQQNLVIEYFLVEFDHIFR